MKKTQNAKCKMQNQNLKLKIRVFVILLFCYFVIFNLVLAQGTDDFIYPVDDPNLSEIAVFGWQRNDDIYHLGDDFLAPSGTRVLAFADGVVKHFGIHSRFGTVVLIEHRLLSGEKIVSLYGHLRRYDIQVSENQFVNKGEVIGFIGAAGRENGYWPQGHVHFGLRRGEYIDVKTKWVYWGYGSREELKNWYNPTEFLAGKITKTIDPKNKTKIVAIPASRGWAHLKMFDAEGKKIENSDIYAGREDYYSGGDITVARTDTNGGLTIIVGLGKKNFPYIKVYNKKDKVLMTKFLAFPKKYRHGLRVAAGDINGDGIDEIIVGSSEKLRAQFKIFDLEGNLILRKYISSKKNKMKSNLDVATGDTDNDGIDEIIVGQGKNSKPYVKIFKVDGTLIKSFLAYNKSFRGGVNVTSGDIDRDGIDEIITGPASAGGPHLRVFEPNGVPRPIDFFPFDKNFYGGVDVATVDFDNDGKDEIVVSPASLAQAWIKVYRYNAKRTVLANFRAYRASFKGGVNVAGVK